MSVICFTVKNSEEIADLPEAGRESQRINKQQIILCGSLRNTLRHFAVNSSNIVDEITNLISSIILWWSLVFWCVVPKAYLRRWLFLYY